MIKHFVMWKLTPARDPNCDVVLYSELPNLIQPQILTPLSK